jgi:hypothetical protein
MDGRAVHRLGQHWASKQHLSTMPHSAHSSPNTTNRPPSCTVGLDGLSSNSSSPQPHAVHALMHAPSNIGWRSSTASPNSSSPQPHTARGTRGTTLNPNLNRLGAPFFPSIARASPARSARCWASEASAPAAPTAGARSPTTTGSSRWPAWRPGPCCLQQRSAGGLAVWLV